VYMLMSGLRLSNLNKETTTTTTNQTSPSDNSNDR